MCTDITFLLKLEPPPPDRLSAKTSGNMAAISGENCESRSKTDDYLLKLKVVGLDSDLYSLPRPRGP